MFWPYWTASVVNLVHSYTRNARLPPVGQDAIAMSSAELHGSGESSLGQFFNGLVRPLPPACDSS